MLNLQSKSKIIQQTITMKQIKFSQNMILSCSGWSISYLAQTGRKRNLAPREREIKVLTKGSIFHPLALSDELMQPQWRAKAWLQRWRVRESKGDYNAKPLFIEEDSPIRGNPTRANMITQAAKLFLMNFGTCVSKTQTRNFWLN